MGLSSFLMPSETQFLENFVSEYEDIVPELLSVYRGKTGCLETGIGSKDLDETKWFKYFEYSESALVKLTRVWRRWLLKEKDVRTASTILWLGTILTGCLYLLGNVCMENFKNLNNGIHLEYVNIQLCIVECYQTCCFMLMKVTDFHKSTDSSLSCEFIFIFLHLLM